MFLKSISITALGGVKQFSQTFRGVFSKLETESPDEILFAIGKVLFNRPDGSARRVKAAKNTLITAQIAAECFRYTVTLRGAGLKMTAYALGEDGTECEATEQYLSFTRRSAEEDRLCLFDENARDKRDLRAYLEEEKNYKPGELAVLTDGIAKTQSFRNALRAYLDAAPLSCAYDEGILPCLDTVRFWDGFGELRDIHYEGKPLLIRKPSPETLKIIAEYRYSIDRQILAIG